MVVDERVVIEIREPRDSFLLTESKSAVADGAVFDPESVDRFLAIHDTSPPPQRAVEEGTEVAVGEFPYRAVVPAVAVECVEADEFGDAVVDDAFLGQVVHRCHAEQLVVLRAVGGLPEPVDVVEMEAAFNFVCNTKR